jgi:FkbM family methyltransferase
MEVTADQAANGHRLATRMSVTDARPARPGVSPSAVGDDRRAEQTFQRIARARRFSSRLPGLWDRRVRDLGKAVVNYRGARRSYGRQVLFGLARHGSDVLLAPFGRAHLLVPSDDLEIGRVVFATGGYERVYMAHATAELRRMGFPVDGTTFVDIGANIGTSTVDALVEFGFGRAVCFEPDERSFRLLMANVALNGLDSRVRAFHAALSSTDGSSLLERSSTNRGDNRLISRESQQDGERRSPGGDHVVRVPCRRFDALVGEGVIALADVGVMWLDAQGHEPFVLQGATEALEAGIPLVMEYSPADLEASRSLGELEGLVRRHYTTVIDLHLLASGLRSQAVLAAADIGRLRDRADGRHTDLLVVRAPRHHE